MKVRIELPTSLWRSALVIMQGWKDSARSSVVLRTWVPFDY